MAAEHAWVQHFCMGFSVELLQKIAFGTCMCFAIGCELFRNEFHRLLVAEPVDSSFCFLVDAVLKFMVAHRECGFVVFESLGFIATFFVELSE